MGKWLCFFFSSRRRHTRWTGDWSSDVCSSDLVGEPNFQIIQRYVDEMVTASEEAIIAGMRTIWETMKIIIEPSAAVPYAAIVERKIGIAGKRVGIILTGGNVDLDALTWM